MDAGLPGIGHIDQWHLGIPPGGIPLGDGGIGFTATELAAGLSGAALYGAGLSDAGLSDAALSGAALSGAALSGAAPRIGLHTAMAAELPRAGSVRVQVPGYRGKSLIPVLSWLVTYRLARPGAEVSWYLEKQQGPRSFGALLAELGWQDVQRTRDGALARISARPPPLPEAALPEAALPEARQFSAVIGAHELTFLADYGVFSPDRIDDGSRLLAEVMLRRPPAGVIADIGVGYGPLAIAAVRGGIAERAVATDVDCIALWLAERNAAACGVRMDVHCTPDPLQAESTPLTVCNVPTHINAAQSAELMRGLAQRARGGRELLIVVHASLEARYARHLATAGLKAVRHPGPSHVVLEATGRS